MWVLNVDQMWASQESAESLPKSTTCEGQWDSHSKRLCVKDSCTQGQFRGAWPVQLHRTLHSEGLHAWFNALDIQILNNCVFELVFYKSKEPTCHFLLPHWHRVFMMSHEHWIPVNPRCVGVRWDSKWVHSECVMSITEEAEVADRAQRRCLACEWELDSNTKSRQWHSEK